MGDLYICAFTGIYICLLEDVNYVARDTVNTYRCRFNQCITELIYIFMGFTLLIFGLFRLTCPQERVSLFETSWSFFRNFDRMWALQVLAVLHQGFGKEERE